MLRILTIKDIVDIHKTVFHCQFWRFDDGSSIFFQLEDRDTVNGVHQRQPTAQDKAVNLEDIRVGFKILEH